MMIARWGSLSPHDEDLSEIEEELATRQRLLLDAPLECSTISAGFLP